MAEPQLP